MKTYEKIYKHQNKQCFYCGEKTKLSDMEKEHVFPKSKGGRGINNKVLSCHFCNNIKSNLIVEDFIIKVKYMLLDNNENKSKLENVLIKLEQLQSGVKIRGNMHKNASYRTNSVNTKPIIGVAS